MAKQKKPQKKSKPKSKSASLGPDILFRPERSHYVRKVDPPKGCVFCSVREQEPSASTLCLFKGANAMVVMNKYPYNSGHLLVLPLRHTGDYTSLSDAELLEIQLLLKASVGALTKEYAPAGFNMGLNLGAASGAGIPDHLHFHLVPRWNGDTNFFPLLAQTKVVIETLEQTYDRLVPYFNRQAKDESPPSP